MQSTEKERDMRVNEADESMSLAGADTIVAGYARVLTRHWQTLSSRVVDFVSGEGAGSTQGRDGLGVGGDVHQTVRAVVDIMGTPVVNKVRRASRGEAAHGSLLEATFPQLLSYRDSLLCDDAEFSIVAAFRAAQSNAKSILSTLDVGLRTPWEAAATGVDL